MVLRLIILILTRNIQRLIKVSPFALTNLYNKWQFSQIYADIHRVTVLEPYPDSVNF